MARKGREVMTSKQATWLFANGGGVVYHDHLYNIRYVDEAKDRCTLISLPYEWQVLNVPLSKITAEEYYDWNKAIIKPVEDNEDED